MHPLERQNAASVDIIDGLTNIEVAPDALPALNRQSTGARVTVGFRHSRPLPPDCEISLYYDLAEDGTHRRMRGTPQLTHTLARPGDDLWYHYRLSQWIPAHAVLHVVELLPSEAAYVRLRTEAMSITAHSDHSGDLPAVSANHCHQVES